jgi:hypothetical protein
MCVAHISVLGLPVAVFFPWSFGGFPYFFGIWWLAKDFNRDGNHFLCDFLSSGVPSFCFPAFWQIFSYVFNTSRV